ncbi:MAG: DUF4238 domain-containing protein [Roseovarius sp.]
MAKRSKIHHYVPKVAQRRFCFETEKIWWTEKDSSGQFGVPEVRNIRSTFKERDYYTIVDNDVLSDRVEKNFYAKLDNYWGQLLSEVEKIFDTGGIPEIKGEALDTLLEAVFHFVKRTPEFMLNTDQARDDFAIGEELVETVASTMRLSQYSQKEVNTYLERFKDRKSVVHQGRTVRVKATLPISDKIRDSLKGFTVRWGVVSSKHSLILPSCFIYRLGNGGSNGISNPNMEFWVPVSPKKVLVLLRDPSNCISPLNLIGREQVRSINRYAVSSNRSVASHSKKLLDSLIQ